MSPAHPPRRRRFVGPGLDPVIVGPRPGRLRDRRGRGLRGPMALPGPLSPSSLPIHRTRREAFDRLVAEALTLLDPHFRHHGGDVEIVVEEAPLLPDGWSEPIPTWHVAEEPVRVVLYRLPLSRSRSADELEKAVWTALVDALAEAWHTTPADLDPARS
ncbi:MAG: metallopeptidase family protein [Aeromicrobium sp.]|uniref:metallopeptidase family protein n=1 Tax=Aeromicrobium sp. TaxID=1871063 RepID=UPI0039E637F7